jgi:recombination protein RecR
MYGYTRLMDHLINELTKMPGVGRKSGQRLAFYLLRADDDYVLGLADAMRRVKEGVRFCGECGNLTEGDVCAICANEDRDRTVICVVEDPQDVQAIEKTGQYAGVYHVLMGAISPLDGIGPEDLEISKLVERVAAGAKEVIIATDPDVDGPLPRPAPAAAGAEGLAHRPGPAGGRRPALRRRGYAGKGAGRTDRTRRVK